MYRHSLPIVCFPFASDHLLKWCSAPPPPPSLSLFLSFLLLSLSLALCGYVLPVVYARSKHADGANGGGVGGGGGDDDVIGGAGHVMRETNGTSIPEAEAWCNSEKTCEGFTFKNKVEPYELTNERMNTRRCI